MAVLKPHQYNLIEADGSGKSPFTQSSSAEPLAFTQNRVIKNTYVTTKKKLEAATRPIPKSPAHPTSAPSHSNVPASPQPSFEEVFAQEKESYLADIQQQKEAAISEGYQEGVRQGREEGEAQYRAKISDMIDEIAGITREKNKVLKKSKGEILNLSMKIAEQILKSEISFNQAVCLNIVSEALSRITDKDQVIVRVGSADFGYINSHKDWLHKQMPDIKNLSVQEDKHIEQGGCIIETRLGFIDSTISTKLTIIRAAIEKAYKEESAEG